MDDDANVSMTTCKENFLESISVVRQGTNKNKINVFHKKKGDDNQIKTNVVETGEGSRRLLQMTRGLRDIY